MKEETAVVRVLFAKDNSVCYNAEIKHASTSGSGLLYIKGISL